VAGRSQRRPLIAPVLVALIGCAHAPPEAPAPAVKKPARIEAGENQTDPVRKSCKAAGPQIPAGETVSGIVRATYLVGADGKVTDVKVTGKGSAGALQAVQRFIAGCTYAPARRDGKPVAVRWRGELDFTGSR
jgi:outer membrane biosynthesis protein TonB